jgi:hypothetical protein
MSVKQYPYYLFKHVVTTSTQDGDGNWSTATDSWVLHSVCREETNGKGSLIRGVDGQAIVFGSTIYMPKSAAKLAEGTEILVSESNDSNGVCRIKGEVLKFDVGQLSCRLWV